MMWQTVVTIVVIIVAAIANYMYKAQPAAIWQDLTILSWWLLFGLIFIINVLSAFILWRKISWRSLIPLAVWIFGIVFLLFPVLWYAGNQSDKFLLSHMPRYMQIVRDISADGDLPPGYIIKEPYAYSERGVDLPAEDKRLAPYGVYYSKTNGVVTVEFKLLRRWGSGGIGYVYRSNGIFDFNSSQYGRIQSETNWATYDGNVHGVHKAKPRAVGDE
jgi:hypothetical protein